MPKGADLEDVLYQRGIHPLRSNAHPNPFYVPVVPQTVPSPVRLQTLPRTAVRPVIPESESRYGSISDGDNGSEPGNSNHYGEEYKSSAMKSDYLRDYYEMHPDDSD